jgi:pimeloyl-ACP methyl ester carboxylesterase
MKLLYKNNTAKTRIIELYSEKLNSLKIDYEEIDVNTSFGKTRVIKTGNDKGQIVILFHGINAGSPVTLEAVKDLRSKYLFYAIDTVGQTTKSAENRLDIKGNDYAVWADEVLEQLSIQKANFIGVSYGAYILQKLMIYKPERLMKSLLIVPSGLVNGSFWTSMRKLTIPLIKYLITKKDKDLKVFINSFVPEKDEFMTRFQKELLLGVNMDFRRPLLLQKNDVKHFTKPVYLMTADNDIFFPSGAAIERAKSIFQNILDIHILKDSKHMPSVDKYPEIQQKIEQWIG